MRLPSGLLGLAVAAVLGTSAVADQPASDSTAPIVVTGSREKQAEAAANQAKVVTLRPSGDAPLPRHYTPLCIKTFGIDPAYGEVLAERVAANARTLGLNVAKPGCVPNVWIGFVRDSKAEVAKLRKSDPALFSRLKQFEIDRIFGGSGAAQVWHSTEKRSEDGRPIPIIRIEVPGSPRPMEVEVNQQYQGGRTVSPIRVDINGSIVIFDSNRANGLTVQQLADYATFRILAPVQDIAAVEPGTVPSILTLFAAGNPAVPDGLTEFDWAYLSALYKLDRGAKAASIHDATEKAMLDGTATGLSEKSRTD